MFVCLCVRVFVCSETRDFRSVFEVSARAASVTPEGLGTPPPIHLLERRTTALRGFIVEWGGGEESFGGISIWGEGGGRVFGRHPPSMKFLQTFHKEWVGVL